MYEVIQARRISCPRRRCEVTKSPPPNSLSRLVPSHQAIQVKLCAVEGRAGRGEDPLAEKALTSSQQRLCGGF